jgi:hypothetical protein
MNWQDKDRCNWCSVCGVRGMLPFKDCWFCTDTPSWHHGRCCPGKKSGYCAHFKSPHRGGTDAFVRELDGASREQRGTPDIYGLSQTSESIASSGPTSRSKAPPVVSSCGFAVSCVRPIFGVSSPSYGIEPLLAAPASAHNEFFVHWPSPWPPAGAARGSDAELWELREERASTSGQFARHTLLGNISHVPKGPLVAAPPLHRSYWVVLRAVPGIADSGQLVGPYCDIAGYVERADGILVPSVVFQGFATAREAQAYWTGAGFPIPVRNVLPLRPS